jgi:radical SAM superfamily enzyme YgiQ (UPF0313 family)
VWCIVSRMKVTLVSHKYAVSIHDPCCYPFSTLYLSAVLKQQGHTVKVLNYNLWDYDLVAEVRGQDAVLFTGYSEFLPYIIRDAAICRGQGVHTVVGGALATFTPERMLNHCDCVVIGEGEDVVAQALTHQSILQGTRPRLDRLPLPDYEGFDIDEYHRRHTRRYMGILTSRGCPYSCRFCAHTCSYQCRSLSNVWQEIDHYQQRYRIDTLILNDNTANPTRDRFMALCKGMHGRGLAWSAAIRADIFDDEMAQAFRNSGGQYFVIGIESFRQEKLDAMNKRVKVEQITRALDTLHRHGIGYHGNVLLGLPGESYEGILTEMNEIPLSYNVFPVMVQPFLGTEYQERSVTVEQAAALNRQCVAYAESKGMSCYPMT